MLTVESSIRSSEDSHGDEERALPIFCGAAQCCFCKQMRRVNLHDDDNEKFVRVNLFRFQRFVLWHGGCCDR